MKKIKFLIAAMVILFSCEAQDLQPANVDVSDFAKWPAGNNKPIKKAAGINININNISAAEEATFLKKSFVTGIYKDTAIAKSDLSVFIGNGLTYDPSTKKCKIAISDKYPGLNEHDSLEITLVKDGSKDTIYAVMLGKKSTPKPAAADAAPGEGATTVQALAIDPACLEKYYTDNFITNAVYYRTDVGYKKPDDKYAVHIFYDQTGSYLYGSKPTGIQRKYHYVIHILYNTEDIKLFRYAIDATGELNDVLSVFNSGSVSREQGLKIGEKPTAKPQDCSMLGDGAFNIFPTSDDVSFTLYYLPLSDDKKTLPQVKLKTYTIKKTPYYFASLNAGGVYTWLNNPSYALVNVPSGTAGDKTVKITDNSPSVNMVIMSTIYFSLYNLIAPYKDGDKKKQKYHWWGRSYLDDDGCLFRKIYPAVGVGLNGTVLNNFYAGLNFEPMQGFGIFVGQNIRKVNTFDMPGFTPGTTVVTQDQFDYYQNAKFKTGWALGVILDVSIFTKLFGSISQAGGSSSGDNSKKE